MSRNRRPAPSFDLLSGYDWFIPGWIDFLWIAIMLGVGLVISTIASISLDKAGFQPIYIQTIVYPLLFIPAMLLASSQSKRNMFRIPARPMDRKGYWHLAPAVTVSVGMIALAILLDPLNLVMPPMSPEMETAMRMLADGPVVISLLCTAVFAPILEEWLFRGIILRGLLGKLKPVWAILISALVFGAFHVNLWQAVPATLMGLFLGYVYWKSGSLKLTMLMHCVNNTLSVLMLQVPGQEVTDTLYDLLGSPVLYGGLLALAAAIFATSIVYVRKNMKVPSSEEEAPQD